MTCATGNGTDRPAPCMYRHNCAEAGSLCWQYEPDCELYRLMSDLSEHCWCAGWLIGTEHSLHELAHAGGGHWGMHEVTAEDAAELLRLAEEKGGWWTWPEFLLDGMDSDYPVFVSGWVPGREGA